MIYLKSYRIKFRARFPNIKVVIEPETSFFMTDINPNYPVDNVFSSGISFIE